ncbi:MAG: hypothetical protein U1E76_21220 [Planctomycetota bacterium]
MFALGTWTHLVFLPVPLVLFLGALITLRGRVLRSRIASCALAGFALGLLPRIVQQFRSPGALEGNVPLADQLREMVLAAAVLLEWPQLFARVVHGDVLYRRHRRGELADLAAPERAAGDRTRRPRRARHLQVRRALRARSWHPRVPAGRVPGDAPAHAYNADRYLLLILYYVPLLAILFESPGSLAAAPQSAAVPGKIAFAGLSFNVSRTGNTSPHTSRAVASSRCSSSATWPRPAIVSAAISSTT